MICFVSATGFTGGPLAIHQAAQKIQALGGASGVLYVRGRKQARMVRSSGGHIKSAMGYLRRRKIHDNLRAFGFSTMQAFSKDAHFIVPEVFPGLAYHLLELGCKNVSIWWLSVDNFPLSELQTLQSQRVFRDCGHLCQSAYAADFVRKNGAKRVAMLSDEIDLEPPADIPDFSDRSVDICFLPNKAKGADRLISDLSQCFNVRRLENMSRDQILSTLLDTKIFLDFGHHPGKDRVPREAALCGAIPVVRKVGAAAFHKDVPLPSDLLIETEVFFDSDRLIAQVKSVIENAAAYKSEMEAYCQLIGAEKDIFSNEVRALVDGSVFGGDA